MTKRMLIDASHAEETRVVVLDGNRLEDYDVETATKRQLKGNIYLAKVVRVEPSLQAAFVEYGGNRHGFLAFGEIHPDYYQIPVADRQRLIEMQEQEAREEEEAEERAAMAASRHHPEEREGGAGSDGDDAAPIDAATAATVAAAEAAAASADEASDPEAGEPRAPSSRASSGPRSSSAHSPDPRTPGSPGQEPPEEEQGSPTPIGDAQEQGPAPDDEPEPSSRTQAASITPEIISGEIVTGEIVTGDDERISEPAEDSADEMSPAGLGADLALEAAEPVPEAGHAGERSASWSNGDSDSEAPALPPETLGGEAEERPERRPPPRFMRHYKIQEVIRRRQILLIQVVKEERGTKGAALTTYVSLAGRYCVLMPNSPRGGGISRKITSAADRKRLREVVTELAMPRGMGLIVRTAGANRPKPEIKRDCEYLLRLWDDIRERTMESTAPALIYEEANLIKRTIRDVYSRDVDEVIVDGEEAWKAARDFMRMLMPSHARKVQLWSDGGQPLFARNQVDAQLDAMLSPTVQLRSGGYLVINQTEALVAIDVNSGRSTRERGIEETALRTNMEAAEEVARQLRLRDLAGLIVIDFIDMESRKHNAMVEKRIKDALKNDRARIQLGHISHFGLLEMSRQRLRPSLAETSFVACPHCGGTGHVRSTESAALHVLRAIEEEGGKRRAAEIVVHVAPDSALYILNHKRDRLGEIELRYAMRVSFAADPSMLPSQLRIEKVRAQTADALPPAIRPDVPLIAAPPPGIEAEEDELETEEGEEEEAEAEGLETQAEVAPPGETAEEGEHRRRRRRRRRRGGRRDEAGAMAAGEEPVPVDAPQPEIGGPSADAEATPEIVPEAAAPELLAEEVAPAPEPVAEEAPRRRPRSRRRRRDETPAAAEPAPAPYSGPTPADPFGGNAFDIFDAIEQAASGVPAAMPAPTPRSVQPARMTADEAVSAAGAPEIDVPESAVAEPALPETGVPETEVSETGVPEAGLELGHVETAAPTLVDTSSAIAIAIPPPPMAVAAPAMAAEPPPAAEPEPGAEEPRIGPAVQPVVIADAPPEAARKRGWWRR